MCHRSLFLWLIFLARTAGAFLGRPHEKRRRRRALSAAIELPNFCSNCGSASMELRVPENDERLRACCNDCNSVVYSNPKIVVACVVLDDTGDYCLLGRRAIEPRKGYWGIPQGFMEHGETTREAAVREVFEETGAIVLPDDLRFRAIYNVPGSVQLVYEARVDGNVKLPETTLESTEIKFFSHQSLPELCFPTVQWAIDHVRSSTSTATNRIQQKTKFYDAATDKWGVFEDEAL